MGELQFRIAEREDLPRIIEIYNSTIASRMVTADLEEVTVEQRLPWFEAHNPEKRPLWVMELNHEICGWISFQDFYGRVAYGATVEVSIYLDAKFRGHGLGKKAIQYALEMCPNYKIETLLGFIFAQNEPSIRLFKHFGFESWGHLPAVAELDGKKCDLVILGKKIS
ncbi:GNAT family N-acetyltransferase [Kurthia zopfii]|uniref:GNAT family N-acetyltransferase n=1 Tax=Kurthia zopfii TaxID=1650 RepID=UPI000F6E8FE3|nr:GNAT family N-acetyltransferase [Kurthia zopfii]VEI07078.1 Putative phosphinothricin acetyltransferase YwnH [Kurthia zopfii]